MIEDQMFLKKEENGVIGKIPRQRRLQILIKQRKGQKEKE